MPAFTGSHKIPGAKFSVSFRALKFYLKVEIAVSGLHKEFSVPYMLFDQYINFLLPLISTIISKS